MSEKNSVLIGRKPVMNYVLACLTLFQRGAKEIDIKARGRAITTAVDVAEIVNRRFMKDLNVSDIVIGTEEIQQQEGGTRNVSTIEIRLARKPEPSAKKEEAKTVELTKVTGIGAKTAKNLTEEGIENANELASSNPEKVMGAIGSSEERASSLIEDARSLAEQ